MHTNSILDEEFKEINADFERVAKRVNLPFQTVVNRFTKQFARTCSLNWWNVYERFYAANKAQEQARVRDRDVIVEATPGSKCR